MRNGIFLGILFVFTCILEMSFFHALPEPFSHIPLVLLVGIILLHLVLEVGVIWFFMSFIFLLCGLLTGSLLSFLPVAALGLVLVRYFFSRRSIYGLMGLGACLLTLFFFLNYLQGFSGTPSLLLLSEGSLFFLFSLWRSLQKFFHRNLLLRGV